MNNRIEELTTHARDWANAETRHLTDIKENIPTFWDLFTHKFAELIVKECIEALEESNGRRSETSSYGMSLLAGDVKKHFGVE